MELEPSSTTLAAVDNETKTVSGNIDESTTVTAVFKNTKKPLINLRVEKLWENVDGTSYPEEQRPESILVQLQRREEGTQGTYTNVGEPVTVTSSYTGWHYSFNGLDQYVDYTANPRVEWKYRVVELKKNSDGTYTVLEEGSENAGFRVTYPAYIESIPEGVDQICVIKNTYAPETNIQITKISASNHDKKLGNVEFRLEKMNNEGTTVDLSLIHI